MDGFYVGQMSGTSMDGVDTALVHLSASRGLQVHQVRHDKFPETLAQDLRSLFDNPEPKSKLAEAVDSDLAALYAQSVQAILTDWDDAEIVAIGCHGQTILHQPDSKNPFSWQAGSPALLARYTRLKVVADFRSADLAAGGQGAPLAPAFHQYLFSVTEKNRAIVNIGGIANVTLLPADFAQSVTGFDTGPGNALSDQWIKLKHGLPFDAAGRMALSAEVDEQLMELFMEDPYFKLQPPKSLDARHFDLKWLQNHLNSLQANRSEVVVQSTLAAFTAESILVGIKLVMPQVDEIFVCGGGANNRAIMQQLAQRSQVLVESTNALGLSADYVEAVAFAWLAYQRLADLPGNLPSVTGADRPAILGKIWEP